MFGIEEDQQLIRAIQNNSEIAFKVVYEQYFAMLCRFLGRMSCDENLAEEIVQRTMVAVWEQRDKIVLKISLKAYLHKVAYHEYLQHIRQRSRFPAIETAVLEAIEEMEDEQDDRQLMERLRAEIENLPPKCREVFELSKLKGLKYKEISELLNISTKTIEAHMTKALSKIRAALEK